MPLNAGWNVVLSTSAPIIPAFEPSSTLSANGLPRTHKALTSPQSAIQFRASVDESQSAGWTAEEFGVQAEKRTRNMELIALELLHDQTAPVGSPRLVTAFRTEGIDVAEATAGRFLRGLDERGLTVRVGRQGRLITERGQQRLRQLRLVERLDERSSELIRILSASEAEELIEILHLRRAVEGEAARLAAVRASDDERRSLRAVALQHSDLVHAEEDGKPAALNFHLQVAKAAHSPIVQATIELLVQPMNDPYMTILDIITIEASAQYGFAHEHGDVADAILAGDPDAAELAMRRHVDALIEVVSRYLDASREEGRAGPQSVPLS